jgi:hypothetical protein
MRISMIFPLEVDGSTIDMEVYICNQCGCMTTDQEEFKEHKDTCEKL